jgi:predicted dehydrogenase
MAVMDVVSQRAEELAAACGGRGFTELAPALDEVDAVYVCSPPTLHCEHVVAAVSAGKHVFCEKPLAATIEDGRAIVAAVSASPVRAMVGFNNRFRPAFRRWRELVRDELGTPYGRSCAGRERARLSAPTRSQPRRGSDLGYRAETEYFMRCLAGERDPDVTVKDGPAALEVSIALLAAAHEGGMVVDDSARRRHRPLSRS